MIRGQSLRGAIDLVIKTGVRERKYLSLIIRKCPRRLSRKIYAAVLEFCCLDLHPHFFVALGFCRVDRQIEFPHFLYEFDAHTGIFYNYFVRIVGARVRYGAVPQRWKVQTFTQHMHEIVVAVLD